MRREKVETSGIWRWPLMRQIRYGTRGTGVEVMSEQTRGLRARIEGAKVSRSICPYCGVGCGQLVYHKDGKVIQIEGDPESPISQGNLCPKGAASRQLLEHEGRETKVKYRPPYAKKWQDLTLYEAMDMIADRVWETRKRTFIERTPDGSYVNHTTAITHLGGATLDNEENYLIRKLFGAGLGMVAISNQARI
jgi:formate dehydrogenase major subunit